MKVRKKQAANREYNEFQAQKEASQKRNRPVNEHVDDQFYATLPVKSRDSAEVGSDQTQSLFINVF